MKSFSASVIEYKKQLDKGDIQIAYRGLLEYMMGLINKSRQNIGIYLNPKT
jgi:hypothetical protein